MVEIVQWFEHEYVMHCPNFFLQLIGHDHSPMKESQINTFNKIVKINDSYLIKTTK